MEGSSPGVSIARTESRTETEKGLKRPEAEGVAVLGRSGPSPFPPHSNRNPSRVRARTESHSHTGVVGDDSDEGAVGEGLGSGHPLRFQTLEESCRLRMSGLDIVCPTPTPTLDGCRVGRKLVPGVEVDLRTTPLSARSFLVSCVSDRLFLRVRWDRTLKCRTSLVSETLEGRDLLSSPGRGVNE